MYMYGICTHKPTCTPKGECNISGTALVPVLELSDVLLEKNSIAFIA